jgi:hypothetical protein
VTGAGAACSFPTGVCYDPAWPRWKMPATKSLTVVGNTVRDNITKLVWQRSVTTQTYAWQDAIDYCAGLTIDGMIGWRLPTRVEVLSITDPTRSNPPIDPGAFPNTPLTTDYWTSSTFGNGAGVYSWQGGSVGSILNRGARNVALFARCVR